MTDAVPTSQRCRIVILGAGGTGLDALEILEAVNTRREGGRYEYLGFLDDDERRWGSETEGLRVLGPLAMVSEMPDVRVVYAIGSPRNFRNRLAIAERLGLGTERLETLVHPNAVVSPRCNVGNGVIVYPNVVLGPRARIGDGVTILANSVVNHDTDVGNWTLIASGVNLSGGVRVGAECYIGSGAAIREGVHVGNGALVGLGAVVTKDVPALAVVVGNPARPIRSHPGLP